jgi:hypothetical protein
VGLREFQRALKAMDADLPKQLRLVLNEAADVVLDYARPRVPTKTGRARSSLKARSSQREVRIAVGGTKAPYYPWLDFGGEGKRRGRPAARPFVRAGRYLYPGLAANHEQVTEIMSRGLTELAKSAGLDVT